MPYRFITADVFTDQPFGGNQLAVFPDGQGLTSTQMQQIAREFNFSETVFALPPDDPAHTRRLRIFTPGAELPFAGHPTVGAAHVLASIGEVSLIGDETRIILEEGVGPVPVTIRSRAGQPVFAQLTAARLPERGPQPPSVEQLAAVLSLSPDDLLSDDHDRPEAYSCGVPFLFVPLRSRAAVGRARMNLERYEAILTGYWASEVFVFSYEAERPGSDTRARMFAPAFGITEDPATGSAVASFGGYLGSRASETDGTLRWRVEQGFEMGRPSILELEVDKRGGDITAVRVGGASVIMMEGVLHVQGDA